MNGNDDHGRFLKKDPYPILIAVISHINFIVTIIILANDFNNECIGNSSTPNAIEPTMHLSKTILKKC